MEAPDAWLDSPDAWLKAPEAWLKVREAWLKVLDAWLDSPDAWLKAPEAWLKVREAWLKVPEACLEAPEAWLEASEAWLEAWLGGRTYVRTKSPYSIGHRPLRGRCLKSRQREETFNCHAVSLYFLMTFTRPFLYDLHVRAL